MAHDAEAAAMDVRKELREGVGEGPLVSEKNKIPEPRGMAWVAADRGGGGSGRMGWQGGHGQRWQAIRLALAAGAKVMRGWAAEAELPFPPSRRGWWHSSFSRLYSDDPFRQEAPVGYQISTVDEVLPGNAHI
jgi:hypothetical protein